MATFRAIAATSAALREVLVRAAAEDGVPDGRFPELSKLEVRHVTGLDLQKAQEAEDASPVLTIYLYRAVVSPQGRNARPTDPDGALLPPIPLDLHYLVTAWAKDALVQQQLLGWAMRTIADAGDLPAAVLNGWLPTVFRGPETVQLILEPMSVDDEWRVWEVADTSRRLSATYVARMVWIESERRREVGPPVQTRDFRYSPDPADLREGVLR